MRFGRKLSLALICLQPQLLLDQWRTLHLDHERSRDQSPTFNLLSITDLNFKGRVFAQNPS